MVLGLSSLANSSCNSDSHRMSNYINLSSLCISKHCLYKSSYVKDIFFGVVVLVCKIGIGRSPCGSVKLCFFITLSSQICSQLPEASLPRDITISGSSSESNVTVSMDKDNRNFHNFLKAAVFSSKSSTFKVGSIKIPG